MKTGLPLCLFTLSCLLLPPMADDVRAGWFSSEPSAEEKIATDPANAEGFKLAAEMWTAELKNKANFPLVCDASIRKNDENKRISIAIETVASMKPELSLQLADAAIRRYGSLTAMAVEGLKDPGKDYYGGIFDAYDVLIIVYPQGTRGNDPFVQDAIIKGMHTKRGLRLTKAYAK